MVECVNKWRGCFEKPVDKQYISCDMKTFVRRSTSRRTISAPQNVCTQMFDKKNNDYINYAFASHFLRSSLWDLLLMLIFGFQSIFMCCVHEMKWKEKKRNKSYELQVVTMTNMTTVMAANQHSWLQLQDNRTSPTLVAFIAHFRRA